MIYVFRDLSAPEELASPRFERLMQEARRFYELPEKMRVQRRFDIGKEIGRLRKIVKPALLKLFHGKCAFCESEVGATAELDLEHFRPKTGAIDLEGERSPDHYWWLTFEWENLYPSCQLCNRTKGARFPIAGESRARVGAQGDELREEIPLLLDPCLDDPGRYLQFSEDGSVAAVLLEDLSDEEKSRFGDQNPGQITIDTFGLNRSSLVHHRSQEAERFRKDLQVMKKIKDLDMLLGLHVPYLQMKRQLYQAWASDYDLPSAKKLDSDSFSPSLKNFGAMPLKGFDAMRKRAFEKQAAYEEKISQSSVEFSEEADQYRARTNYIEKVEIQGFTSMKDFSFDFDAPSSSSDGKAPWLMLLGENGVGKSSVLKAIALALAGPQRLEQLQGNSNIAGITQLFHEGGFVRIYLTSQKEPLEVRRIGSELIYEGKGKGAKSFVRAFGPSRWFPAPNSIAPESHDFVRIENLFNPFVPLESGEEYLTKLEGPRWDDVAMGLKELLQISELGELSNEDGVIKLKLPGGEPRPLRSLSAGFEAVIAMAADLIHLLGQRWQSLRDAEGIVLLDEIGAHLHPRWRMRIVESLRQTFPRVQFLATTHEPLCLRGLRKGEILVMQKPLNEGEESSSVTTIRPDQDVADLRIDQLLTSRLFGLQSTLDPELEGDFDRYYSLLSRHEETLSLAEKIDLEDLTERVGKRGVLGSTRRDQMIYRMIDQFIAKERDYSSEEERAEGERLTMKEVADFWGNIGDQPPEEAS